MKNKKTVEEINAEKGKRLKLALKKRGFTQVKLAGEMGTTKQYVSQTLCGRGEYSLSKLTEILSIIGMTHAAFFSINIEEE